MKQTTLSFEIGDYRASIFVKNNRVFHMSTNLPPRGLEKFLHGDYPWINVKCEHFFGDLTGHLKNIFDMKISYCYFWSLKK